MANTFKRMEKKTTLPTERVEEFKARIAPYMNNDPYNIDGKPYMICNLYYDDFDDHVIRGSVQLPKYKEKLRLREHAKEELSHYSNGTTDVEYEFPFGWGELWGIASRTNYDLTQHQNESKVKQEYIDPVQNKRYIPYVVEPSLGVERLLLVLLCDAYDVEKLENDERTVLHFDEGRRSPAGEEGPGEGQGRRALPEAPEPLERGIRRNAVYR